jgi:hypothetical protein
MRGGGKNQLKISAPHPMTETYRLIPLLAALISLDSPFKGLQIGFFKMILRGTIERHPRIIKRKKATKPKRPAVPPPSSPKERPTSSCQGPPCSQRGSPSSR